MSRSTTRPDGIDFKDTRQIPIESVLSLYRANGWSSAEKPQELWCGLRHSHALVTAWDGPKLVGLANAISDGFLVVYYPHLLVLPEYQRRGIGRTLVRMLQWKYKSFHQQILIADGRTTDFYRKCGFEPAGHTQSMWIYDGHDH
jgi:GNAT superfamily N-acetyltransferase